MVKGDKSGKPRVEKTTEENGEEVAVGPARTQLPVTEPSGTRGSARPLPPKTRAITNRGLTLIWLTMRTILFDKKTILVIIMLLALLAIPAKWLSEPPNDEEGAALQAFLMIVVVLYLQFIVLYVCLLYGSSIITSEVEDRTLTYILSRPITKLEIILFKYIGYVISVFLLFALPTVLNYLMLAPYEDGASGLSSNADFLAFSLGGMFMGIMAWGAFFMMLATMVKNPLMPGLVYCLFWESLIANIGGNISKFTLTYQIRTFIARGITESRGAFGDNPWGDYPSWQAFVAAMVVAVICLLLAWQAMKGKDFH
jgi:ABC-2 type transport system permease protein